MSGPVGAHRQRVLERRIKEKELVFNHMNCRRIMEIGLSEVLAILPALITSTPLSYNALKVQIAQVLNIEVDHEVLVDHKQTIKDRYVLEHERVTKLAKKPKKGSDQKRQSVTASAQGGEADSSDGQTAKKVAEAGKRSILRNFSLKHQYNILTEAVHGNHRKADGTKIECTDRNKYSCIGPFYASICSVLNDKKSYPAFYKAKAVATTVKKWLDTAVEERIDWLSQNLSPNFMDHRDFMKDHGHSIVSSDAEDNAVLKEEKISDDRYELMNKELLDSLIRLDKIHETRSQPETLTAGTGTHTSSQEDVLTEDKVDGLTQKGADDDVLSEETTKKKRKHKLERPREKKANPAVQLQEQQSSIAQMLDKLMNFSSIDVPSSVAPADFAIQTIRSSLLALPTPPGTLTVCDRLANSLADYGFCSLQELLDSHASSSNGTRSILTDLKWSPLQIDKVLGPKGPASAAAGGGAAADA